MKYFLSLFIIKQVQLFFQRDRFIKVKSVVPGFKPDTININLKLKFNAI